MQDKLVSLLKIKIDAINRNIDNLKYLNGELDKNNENLEYIVDKIKLFESDNILNFDKVDKADFERVLLIVNSKVSEIFQEKSCNYQGIMYIIQGIRQGISLSLTGEQTNAILSFQEGMLEYENELKEKINDLLESKERLPEVDLDILFKDLEKYNNIVSKLEKENYLTEIDDIVSVLDFSNVHAEEKSLIFEYILKYNANIYSKEKVEIKEEIKEEIPFEEVKIPEFHYEPVDISEVSKEKEEQEVINLNDFGTLQMPILDTYKYDVPDFLTPVNEEIKLNEEVSTTEDDIDYNIDEILERLDEKVKLLEQEQKESEEIDKEEEIEKTNNLNTVDLEEIIKQIDAKLSEIEKEEVPVEVESNLKIEEEPISIPTTPLELNAINQFPNSDELTFQKEINEEAKEEIKEVKLAEEQEEFLIEDKENDTALKEVLAKYNLNDSLLETINKSNKKIDVFEIDCVLTILNENKLLEIVNEDVLSFILINNNKNKINELFSLIKENFVSKNDNFETIINIVVKSMPLLLGNSLVIDTFKTNIEFFKDHQINLINLFDNYRELLIVETNLLKENFDKITKYNLILNNDNVKYLLYNNKVLENVDYYIEAMGSEKGFLGSREEFNGLDYINKNPYKLNMIGQTTLMKLRYSSENDMKIYGSKPGILAGEIANPKVDLLVLPEEYKNLYFNHEYSFLDRSEVLSLQEELKTVNTFDVTVDTNIEKMDSLYKLNDLKYKIENVVFSRMKTIRLYNFLKGKGMNLKNALLIALTYNSVIKKEEYTKVESIISSLVEGGN